MGMTSATTSRLILSRRFSARNRRSRFLTWKPASPAVALVPSQAVVPPPAAPAAVPVRFFGLRERLSAASPRWLNARPVLVRTTKKVKKKKKKKGKKKKKKKKKK